MQFVIYKIYWAGKGFYYGKTKGYGKRRNRHLREMKDGTHHNKNLVRYYARYGAPKIRIIAKAFNDTDLTQLEKYYLELHKNNRRSLNIQKR